MCWAGGRTAGPRRGEPQVAHRADHRRVQSRGRRCGAMDGAVRRASAGGRTRGPRHHLPGLRPAGLLQMHVLPDPRSFYGRALAVEAAVGGLGPMVLHDSGTGWSAHVFHPQTGSRLLSMEQEIHSHVRLRRLRAAVSPRLNLRTAAHDADRSPRRDAGTARHRRVASAARHAGGPPSSGRAGRHRHSERGGHGALRPRASGAAARARARQARGGRRAPVPDGGAQSAAEGIRYGVAGARDAAS